MKKNLYEKPSMQVLKLKQQLQVLAGSSGGGTGTSPYEVQSLDNW